MGISSSYTKTLKNYDKFRYILHDIFLCNYRTRNQYIQLGISPRSFDDYKRKIKDCIPEEFLQETTISKNRYLQFKTDFYRNSYNFLANTLLIKSLNENSSLYLQILQISNKINKPLNKQDFIEYLDEFFPSAYKLYDITTVYRHLEDLVKDGIFICTKIKKLKYYQLSKSPLDDLSLKELQELYTAVTFYTPISLLTSVGYFTAKTIAGYAQLKFNYTMVEPDYFQYRSNNFIRILDDNIINIIDQAIRTDKAVKFTYAGKQEITVKPKAIYTQYPYNRQTMLDTNNVVFRISKISKIKLLNSYNIQIKRPSSRPRYCLDLLFTFTEQDDEKEITDIKNRLSREACWMTKTIIDDNHWLYTAKVADYKNYIPWIRSFHKFVTPTKNSVPELIKNLEADKKELLEAYGIIF